MLFLRFLTAQHSRKRKYFQQPIQVNHANESIEKHMKSTFDNLNKIAIDCPLGQAKFILVKYLKLHRETWAKR